MVYGVKRFCKPYSSKIVTNSLYLDWDGRANNGDEVAQQDVYVWKVALTDVFDIDHAYVGHVTLVK
ncbi:MAG: hypothetical protein IT235_04375 [Bacteroidia bacterium]|nr:hypothetical protein [Bacteroidia bacterium]